MVLVMVDFIVALVIFSNVFMVGDYVMNKDKCAWLAAIFQKKKMFQPCDYLVSCYLCRFLALFSISL